MDIGSNTVSCLNRRKNTKNIKKSKNTVDNHRNLWYKYSCDAEVAELADAQASGACGSNTVRVQVPPSAFFICENAHDFGHGHFLLSSKR